MSFIVWERPAKVMTEQERTDRYVADGAPPGVYVPNMSATDARKWRGKLIGRNTDKPRIEVRKRTENYVQMLIVVHHDRSIHMSMNGTAHLTANEFSELAVVVDECKSMIFELTHNGH